MTITLGNDVARELVSFKLQHIQSTLQDILAKWNQGNVDDFIQKARSGELPDAEMDAITTRQLVKDLDRLQKLLSSIPLEE